MRKTTKGRRIRHVQKRIILGTSIVPIFQSELYWKQKNSNAKELRVQYIEFEKDKKESFEDALKKHDEKILDAIFNSKSKYRIVGSNGQMTTELGAEQVYALHDIKKSSRIINLRIQN